MQAQIDFHQELERQYENARTRLQNLKQELSSYERVMTLLKDHIDENLSAQKLIKSGSKQDDERKRAILVESHDKLIARYERFKTSKIDREEEYKRQLNEKNKLEVHLNSMKAQMISIEKVQAAELDGALNQKQDASFDYGVETINFLNEGNWNLADSCDRNLAETLLECFPSGTFLVRSSKTKPNSYVLSVVANSKVRHCLIDRVDDEFCFHPPGPNHQFYPSLRNLVMDYRHKSLLVHNTELDTYLIYPVLSQLKKSSRGSSGTQ